MKKTIVSLAAGFLLAGAAATSVSAQEYNVQDGDTLSELSQEFDVSVDDLKAWNDLDSDLIVVNQLLDIQNESASDNAENQDIAPADEQAQQEAPAEPSDDQAAENEADQEADQPEADEEEANAEEETQPEAEPSDDQAAEQEDPQAEEPQQEASDEAVENNKDEAVEQEQQEAPDDQATEQEEVDQETNQPEGNEEETTTDEGNNEDADTSEGETMTMSSTAYTAGCEGCSGTTANGTELSGDENVIAVDPDEIPIGSEVHVEGYGDAVAADTGGDINGDRVDLHMGDEDEANDWGRQDVKVTVKE